jgi:hypothetical protein
MKTYEYVGVEESHKLEHENEKGKLKEVYVRRLRSFLNTEISA